MAKNHEKFEYYDVAVPRTNTLLLRYLHEMHENTNIQASQVLVQCATEYVRQVRGEGPLNTLSAFGSLLPAMTSLFSTMPPSPAPGSGSFLSSGRPPEAVQSLGDDFMRHGAGDEDLDAYGDPD